MTAESTGRLRLLFVDDEQAMLKAIERILRHEGYEMFFVTDLPGALAVLDRQCIDVLVTDQVMPNLRGTDLLRLSRHHGCIHVLMTGMLDGPARASVAEGLADLVIFKPFDAAALRIHMRALDARRHGAVKT